ncbi:MAG TPA: pyridoxamine 5'-phosphate oxidase family protein, partial [Ktedonobacterales bacterium]
MSPTNTAFSDPARAFLEGVRFAIMATVMPDGTPQQSVMWYALRDDHIIMNTKVGRVKHNNLERDPVVSLCFEDAYRYITVRGGV